MNHSKEPKDKKVWLRMTEKYAVRPGGRPKGSKDKKPRSKTGYFLRYAKSGTN